MNNLVLKDGRAQRGVAAVEFAVILPVLVMLLALTLFFGRFFWHYTVAQKAAHDAAIILANATRLEIGTSKADNGDVEVAKFAESVAAEETAELYTGQGRPRIDIYCDGLDCIGEGVPSQVKVVVRMKMFDVFFGGYTGDLGGIDGIWIHAEVQVPYVGK